LEIHAVIGIDAGSTSIKLTLYNGRYMRHWMIPAGWAPKKAAQSLIDQVLAEEELTAEDIKGIVGTGYGRISLPFLSKTMTEIACHAKGAVFLRPGIRTVIDIGGQDAKAIQISQDGKVTDFIMNDKCAAGTGKFIELAARALGLDVHELADFREEDCGQSCRMTSMCAVFAETEIITLLNQGFSRTAIIDAMHHAIASRIAGMAARIDLAGPIFLSGGLAGNKKLVMALEREWKAKVEVHELALYVGAIGAAVEAWDHYAAPGTNTILEDN
jgi:predicted CoA-substrate-specific enzyme activase